MKDLPTGPQTGMSVRVWGLGFRVWGLGLGRYPKSDITWSFGVEGLGLARSIWRCRGRYRWAYASSLRGVGRQ